MKKNKVQDFEPDHFGLPKQTAGGGGDSIVPRPTLSDSGKFLTVGTDGNYQLTTINNANDMTF